MLAAMLALALLSGIVPVGALSSDHQTCQMSCCAGKPAHDAGSCSTAFADEEQSETPDETTAEEHSHAGGMHGASTTEIVEAAHDCGTVAPHSTREPKASSRDASNPARSIIAHALTTPCSPECAAASVNAFGQVRRPRNAVALAAHHRPRPATRAALAELTFKLQILSTVTGRQSGPRAPPLFPEHLPA
jgi:hypothetical protein